MKVVYTVEAIQNLKEALDYTAQQTSDEKASQIKSKLFRQADQLLDNPEMGQKEPYLAHLGLNHRRLVVTNYKIIYRVEGKIVYITDIFYTRQDPKNMKG